MVSFIGHPGLAVVGRETISDVSSSIGLTASFLPPTNPRTSYAVIQAIGGDVRFTDDGVTPPVAGTTGHRLVQDGVIEAWGESMKKLLFIDDGGTAQLEVTYLGRGS